MCDKKISKCDVTLLHTLDPLCELSRPSRIFYGRPYLRICAT